MTQPTPQPSPTNSPPAGGILALLAVFSPGELVALIDAQTAQRVAETRRRAAELAALVEELAPVALAAAGR